MTAAKTREPRERVIADLVTANHILHDQRVVDGFGHISARVSLTRSLPAFP
jgi:hypothetical protein